MDGIDGIDGIDALTQEQNTPNTNTKHKNKTRHWKEQAQISKWTNCQTHTPKYLEAPSFWKFQPNGQPLPV